MLLSELLSGVEVSALPAGLDPCAVSISGVTADSHGELGGRAFVCIRGRKTDGHSFASLAESGGAAVVLCERDAGCQRQILTPDTRAAYARMCANFHGNPADSMTLIAVTGTNGKTSVATTVKRLLEKAGVRAGLVSTIQCEYAAPDGAPRVIELPRTTPDPWDLHRVLAAMRQEGITAVVMEASSQALDQGRLSGLRFAVGVFTNLTQDHLDYHRDMEDYFRAKSRLFEQCACAAVNIDDSYGARLAASLSIPAVSFSVQDASASFHAAGISCGEDGVRFTLRHGGEEIPAFFGIPGLYSVQNALAAAAACRTFGLPMEKIAEGLCTAGSIRGRNELIKTGLGFRVICDYAHTPDGLLNLLRSTREYTKGRIVLLFGCGGDRDRAKRPRMGEIAARYADFLVITSDNPRTENPGAIIGDIIRGVPPATEYIAIVERRDAIRYALVTARKGDTVILAGKGHERYQILGQKALYFDERRLVEGILRSLRSS